MRKDKTAELALLKKKKKKDTIMWIKTNVAFGFLTDINNLIIKVYWTTYWQLSLEVFRE